MPTVSTNGAFLSATIAVVLTATAAWLAPSAAQPNQWTVETLDIDAVTAVRQIDRSIFVEAGRWYRLRTCAGAPCFELQRPPELAAAPNGIPHGAVASSGGIGIVEAWYGDPTTRYDHGILGDRIEAGSLHAIDEIGRRYVLRLDRDHVFEDLTPRIANIDGDGLNDVAAIRSGLATGAAIAVYGIGEGGLVEIASIPDIGLTHRWLNIAGIADFTGDGALDIALVKTPHIGGRLEIWTMQGSAVGLVALADGFSNHVIGSTELGLSAVADIDGDGVVDVVVPSNSRTVLRFVSAADGSLREIASVELGAPITSAIATLVLADSVVFLAALQDGRLILVSR